MTKKQLFPKFEKVLGDLTPNEIIGILFNHYSSTDLKELYDYISEELDLSEDIDYKIDYDE